MITAEIEKALFDNMDLNYKNFHAGLIPNIDFEKIIGVRTPVIKRLAKKFAENPDIADFLDELPHTYYDENVLHGAIVSLNPNYDETIVRLDVFLPFVDNWAVCDLTSPGCFKKNRDKLFFDVCRWLDSDKTYVVRFGVKTAMAHFLDEGFNPALSQKISEIKSDEYYVDMAIAWYFATALAKRWDETLPFILNKKLPVRIHNKAIQKSVESYRISNERKTYLRTLKIK